MATLLDPHHIYKACGDRMTPSGIEFFDRQRSTIDFVYATHVGVDWADCYPKKHKDTDEIFTSIYPDSMSDEVTQRCLHAGIRDLEEIAENLSLSSRTGLLYNIVAVAGGEYAVLLCYLRGEPYYLCYADPIIIYTMGGNRFYPPAKKTTCNVDEWWGKFTFSSYMYSGKLTILNNYPVVMYPLGSEKDATDQSDLKRRLSDNGYHASFLGDVGTTNFHYNYPLRPRNSATPTELGLVDKSTAPEAEYKMQGNMNADEETKITELSGILEKCIPNITDTVKRKFKVKGLAREDLDETVAYDLVFRILDVAIGLVVRKISFEIRHDNIFGTLHAIHMLFILNMSDPQGRKPFSYPRRPLSYYADSMREIRELWKSLTTPFCNQKYQDTYNKMSGRYGSLRTGYAMPNVPITLGTLVKDTMKLPRRRQIESLKRFPNLELVGNEEKRLHYIHFYRDPTMRNLKGSYWNMRMVMITKAEVVMIPKGELEAKGYKKSDILGTDYNTPYGIDERLDRAIVLRKDISISELMAIRPDPDEGQVWRIYIQPQEETPLKHFMLKHKYISINGVRFNSRDILLLYNTTLVDILLSQDEQDIELPNMDSRDLRLLQSLFAGRISMLYFYEHSSKYTYSLLSGKRTMLELFDMLTSRDMIIKGYRVGTPLRVQLSEIHNSIQTTPPRLSELIELAEIASS